MCQDVGTRANEVAAELVGSCKSLDDVATEAERDNMAFCQALDALVLCCEGCGWWIDAEEICTDTGCALCLDCASTE